MLHQVAVAFVDRETEIGDHQGGLRSLRSIEQGLGSAREELVVGSIEGGIST